MLLPGNDDFALTMIGFQTVMLKERTTTTEFALYASPQAMGDGALGLVPKISLVSEIEPHFYPQIPVFPIMLFSIGLASRPLGKS